MINVRIQFLDSIIGSRLKTRTALLLVLIFSVISMNKGHEWGDDFALYMSQADALQHGTLDILSADNGLMMARSDGQLGPNLYPHGYPALLLLVKWLPGGMLVWGKWLNVLLLLLAAVFFFKVFDAEKPTNWLAGVFAFAHPKVLEGVNRLQADFFFYAIFMLFLWILLRWEKGLKRSLLLAFTAWIALEIRPNGLLLLPAVFVSAFDSAEGNFFRRCFLAFKSAALSIAVFVFCFIALRLILPEGSGNLWAILKGINAEIIVSNLRYYFDMIGSYPLWHGISWLKLVFSPIAWVLILAVWYFILRGINVFKLNQWTFIYLFSSFVAMFIIWPSQQGFRYLYPLLPLLMLAFFNGLFRVFNFIKRPNLILTLPALLVLLAQSAVTALFVRFYLPEQAYQPDARKVYSWVKTNTSNTDTIVFFKPRLMYHETGRISFRQDSLHQGSILPHAVVIIPDTARNAALRMFRAGKQQQVFSSGRWAVYRWAKH